MSVNVRNFINASERSDAEDNSVNNDWVSLVFIEKRIRANLELFNEPHFTS